MTEHVVIARIVPGGGCGRYPVKRIAGEPCVVEADVFRDGQAVLRAVLKWRAAGAASWIEIPMACVNEGLDRWRGALVPPACGRYLFTIEAWTDRFASWLVRLRRWAEAGGDDGGERAEGAALLRRVLPRASGGERALLDHSIEALGAAADVETAMAVAAAPALGELMARLQPREDAAVHGPPIELVAERPRARFSAWYELFVRSQATEPGRAGTFADAERRLDDLREMGFDVVYLAPIHPIGRTGRKGRNGALAAGPDDPGCPWAVGNQLGGHTAVDPALGTLADFDRFVRAAAERGIEVALDFAIQCSPDHPWVREHPDWFLRRADGSLQCAENPPHRYDDIVPLDFDGPDAERMKIAWLDVLLFWAARGVRVFRADNPHTKPIPFWRWLIAELQARHPDAILLAEAFTRPALMKALSGVGFTQTYTYFTWRNTKQELTQYLTELAAPDAADTLRPNFFTTTHDVLPPILQSGEPAAFRMRLALAALLSPSYGIYSGFELCEGDAVPGTERYRDSEMYEIRVRDWERPGHIKDLVRRLNRIRRESAALQRLTNLRFLATDSEHVLAFAKAAPDGGHAILAMVNLDPRELREAVVEIPAEIVGRTPGAAVEARDLLSGRVLGWTDRLSVRIDPSETPALILRVESTGGAGA